MHTAVVIGASGIVGRGIVSELYSNGWKVLAVSRSGADVPGASRCIRADLLDREEARRGLTAVAEATHLFYSAYLPQSNFVLEVAPNRALLVNAIEGMERNGAALQHVTLITGAKYYGVHLGPSPSPAQENEIRHVGPNFYFEQEDYLRSRSDADWRWTHLVPTHLTGFAVGNPMNLVLALGVYAAIARELGLRLDFPGNAMAFNAMTHIVDAAQLGAAAHWAATTPAASGEVFNVANGDPVRWSQLWPTIAEQFGLRAGGPRPIPLGTLMAAHASTWKRIEHRYGLRHFDYSSLVNWHFLEFMFGINYDIVLSLGKIRRAGFTAHPETLAGFERRFDDYRRDKILPVY